MEHKDKLNRETVEAFNYLIQADAAEKLQRVLNMAYDAHLGQVRRPDSQGYREAYINHCYRVATAVSKLGGSISAVAAGILHDTVEDTDVTLQQVAEVAGDEAALLVDTLTYRKGEIYEQYIDRVRDGGQWAVALKICDIVDNLTSNPSDGQVDKYRKALIQLTTNAGVQADDTHDA